MQAFSELDQILEFVTRERQTVSLYPRCHPGGQVSAKTEHTKYNQEASPNTTQGNTKNIPNIQTCRFSVHKTHPKKKSISQKQKNPAALKHQRAPTKLTAMRKRNQRKKAARQQQVLYSSCA
jgi:hypothetical protein